MPAKTIEEYVEIYAPLKAAMETTHSNKALSRMLDWPEATVITGRHRLLAAEKYPESLHFLTVREINAVRALGVESKADLVDRLVKDPRFLFRGNCRIGTDSARRIMMVLGVSVPNAYQEK